MEAYRIENLSFEYPLSVNGKKALSEIVTSISDGEFVTICGKSGSGKTTLLKALKPLVTPHGQKSGKITFFGRDITELDLREQASDIGFVHQNPDSAIVTDKVWHEIAFGLESLGTPPEEIKRRVAEICAFFGIEELYHRNTRDLSGGQKQIVCLASVLCMHPRVLLLDEPLSQLDPIAAHEFCRAVERVNRELGITVIASEHRLDELFPVSDRVLVLNDGKICFDGSPDECAVALKEKGSEMYDALPVPSRVFLETKGRGACPVSVREGRGYVAGKLHGVKEIPSCSRPCRDEKREIAVSMREVFFRYERNSEDVIENLSLEICKNKHTCILGSNGAGKSTLLSMLSGEIKPVYGKISILGEGVKKASCARLPQNPMLLFSQNTIEEDLLCVRGVSKEELEENIRLFELENILKSHPADVSGGELQRAGICKLMLIKPEVLLLDEPTKGMDCFAKKELAKIIQRLKCEGKTVITVSHDIEFCAEYADECVMLFCKNISGVAEPKEFFSKNYYYTTAAARMTHGLINNAITVKDAVDSLNNTVKDGNANE